MEGSSDVQHKRDRTLRAIEVVATSGVVGNNKSLQESCLAICNSCREGVPWRGLTVAHGIPRTLLAVFWPELLCAEAEGASKVLLPRRVLKVNWTRDDLDGMKTVKYREEQEEEEEDGEEEAKQDAHSQEEDVEKGNEEEERGRGGRGGEENEQEEQEQESVKNGSVTAGNIDLSKVRWPEGVKEINFSSFNGPVKNVIWPDCLKVLSFRFRSDHESHKNAIFNRPLDGVTFPAGLREIHLGFKFNQRIDGIAWPEGLEQMSLPGFNQPIQDVQWPSGLKVLDFAKPYKIENKDNPFGVVWDTQHGYFNQPLGTSLPMHLEDLWLSGSFDQTLRGVRWPSGLAVLGLGASMSEASIDGVEWPPSLQIILNSNYFLCIKDAPPGCEVCYIDQSSDSDGECGFDQDDIDDLCEADYDIYDNEYGVGDYDGSGSDFSL